MEIRTIQEGKEFLRKNYEKGASCPCCRQYVKLYGRTVTSAMAVGLIQLYRFDRANRDEFVHISTYLESLPSMHGIPRLTGDFAKLAYWDLTEPMASEREDGSRRNGYHRITELGRKFVQGRAEIPMKVYVYDGRRRSVSRNLVGIREALGNKFSYSSLMDG